MGANQYQEQLSQNVYVELLKELIGQKVTIFSNAGDQSVQEVVRIEAIDGDIIKVLKGDRELMYFNLKLIRLIKPF